MRQALKERNIALIVMVALILLGLIFGTRVGISREKRKMLEKYNADGLQNDSVMKDLQDMADRYTEAMKKCAASTNAEAFNSDDYRISFENYEEAVENLKKADTLEKRYRAAKQVNSKAKSLANVVRESVSDAEFKATESALGNLGGKITTLTDGVDKYNIAAGKLNEKMNRFPCNILRKLTFVKEAEIL